MSLDGFFFLCTRSDGPGAMGSDTEPPSSPPSPPASPPPIPPPPPSPERYVADDGTRSDLLDVSIGMNCLKAVTNYKDTFLYEKDMKFFEEL